MTGKRTSKTLLAVAIALQASLAQALGLGEITLRSALDEPLDADVRLRGVGDLSASQILVNLASSADFERAGVERLYSLTEMRFEVELLPNGDGRVHLRTERPVREPYLDFVLEVRWPTGRVLREYTVLLDLPTTSPAPAPVVSAPAVSRMAPSRPAASGGASAGGGSWTGGDSYAVQGGDTLWSIASRTRPSGVSVQQMMVALQRENPEAFIRGNMNLLRAGAVLRVPSAAAVSQDEALGEIASQSREWRSGGTPLPEDSANRAPASADGAGATPAEKAYLELAAGTAGGTGAATGGVEGGAGGAPLQEQLTAVQENLSAKERENAELQSRVSALEEQVENYERLVELKSEGGAAAQQAAGAAPPEATAGDAAASETPAPAPAAAEPAPAPAAPAETAPGLLASLMENTLAMAAALGLLVAGAVAFLFVRRRREEATYGAVPESAHELRAAKAAAAREEAPPVAAAPARGESVPEAADAAPSVPAFVSPAAAATATVSAAPEPEHRDPISEAEIFVAYGRTERALEVLRKALDEDPGRADVRLKLMEMLAEQDDQAGFLAEYDQLAITGDAAGERAARELLVEHGRAHWLADLDQPAGVHSLADEGDIAVPPPPPVAEEPAVDALARLDVDELAQLDTDLHLDADLDVGLDAGPDLGLEDGTGGDVPLAGAGGVSDEELALELGELDFGGGLEGGGIEGAGEAVGEIELDAADDLGSLGEIDLGAEEPALDAGLELPGLDLDEPVAQPPVAEPEPLAAQEPLEDEGDLGLLEGSDEIETKLELARAYVDMGDLDGARDILDEVVAEGSATQRDQANALLERLRGA